MTKLESLPNELFLELFDYFDGVDLLITFSGFNSRLNYLLYKQFRHYRLLFDSVSKRHFDIICQRHLPFIVDRIKTLCLSNDDDTPKQINLFLSYIPSFKSFTQLQLLSLTHVTSYQLLLQLLNQCHYLVDLTGFKLDSCSLAIDQTDFQSIIDKIWSLSKLTFCQLDIINTEQPWLFTPTRISVTLKYVIIYRKSFEFNELNSLYECTPHLKYLSILIAPSFQNYSIRSSFSMLIYLNMRLYERSTDLIIQLLQNTPNLHCLEITLLNNLINGQQWEQIIDNYLLRLKVFRLKMKDTLSNDRHLQGHLEKLFYSFQSSFWIKEHRWFIRCLTWSSTVHLYTLPRRSNYYEQKLPDSRKSTNPYDDDEEFYNNLTNIYDENFFDQSIPYSIRLSNIECLCIKLPINSQFLSIVSTLKQLRSLTLVSHIDTFQSQVQLLLDRASHLQTLSINQDAFLPLQNSLFNYRNTSVHELELQNLNYSFHEQDCIRLTRSPLGSQCRVLSIVVKNRESIITLVRHMNHLRTLKVQLKDESYDYDQKKSNNDEVIHWLKDHLSSTYMIVRNTDTVDRILIWI